jgi:hypothetical protein
VLNRIGAQILVENRPPRPITMPALNLPDLDVELEAAAAAARVAERRIIRTGLDAGREINRAESFEGWRAIVRALAVGRDFALRVTGATRPEGCRYCAEFSQ